jgi:hypothetical protein
VALVESLLPNGKIKDRLGKLCIGLAAPCDLPGREYDVAQLLQAHFPGAPSLPFVGIVTCDLEWICGWAGGKTVDEVGALLEVAETSPLRPAAPEVVKKLEALSAQAAKAVEKSDWKSVLAASKAAGELIGRSPVRDAIVASVAKAREWAADELKKALDAVKAGGDRAAVKSSLRKLSAQFAGEPEAKDADAGVKAVDALIAVEALPEEQQAAAIAKAAKDFAGTPWAELFGVAWR